MTLEELKESIIADLTTELREDPDFNEAVLGSKVAHAVQEVKAACRFPSYYTEAMIMDYMERFYSNVYNIALYEYNQVGIDGQSAHSENGTNRTFISKAELFKGIIPIAVMD